MELLDIVNQHLGTLTLQLAAGRRHCGAIAAVGRLPDHPLHGRRLQQALGRRRAQVRDRGAAAVALLDHLCQFLPHTVWPLLPHGTAVPDLKTGHHCLTPATAVLLGARLCRMQT